MTFFTIFIFALPAILIAIEFTARIFLDKKLFYKWFIFLLTLVNLIVLPGLFIAVDHDQRNDCCDSSTFSPEHRLTVYVLIVLSLLAYYYCLMRKKSGTPVLEIAVNCILLIGFVLNIFIGIHVWNTGAQEDRFVVAIGNIPVFLLFLLMLADNHKLFLKNIDDYSYHEATIFNRSALYILRFRPILKFPVLLLLCAPLFVIISGLLLLFGQKPDSIIRAFTDTYKHGFSKWNHQCDNVQCGGHFLCSVAAKGHPQLVRPERLGIRAGKLIICNRQLLVANAFEELIEQKFPYWHTRIRSNYNIVGNLVHRYYNIFNNKLVADTVYLLMKPMEWFFLLTLYTFYKKPENHIAMQYLKAEERIKIRKAF